MSTHLKAPHQPPTPSSGDAETPEEKKKVFELSFAQITGGALAAMTAAALGSTLGVAGTVAGAALASVVAGVAGSLYTASLKTGHATVRRVFRGSTDAATAPPAPLDPATTIVADRPISSESALQQTQVIPVWDPLPLEKAGSKKHGSKQGAGAGRSDFPWKRAVAVSLSVFALAAVLITGYERVTGQPLSGGTGTTVSQVGDNSPGSGDTETKPSPSASASSTPSETSTPSESASPGTGDEPSASESAGTPSPSTSESTPESSPTPSVSAPAGDQAAGTSG